MKFEETILPGAFVILPEPQEDGRGFFARTFCREEFSARGIDFSVVQCSISFNRAKGTMRGLHYQTRPHEESKIVRCTKGSIFDVIVDLRPESPAFKKWIGVELSAQNRASLFVPKGFAHGFQTLLDDSEVHYQMSESYVPSCAAGVSWDDPALAIRWPLPVTAVSDRDKVFGRLAA